MITQVVRMPTTIVQHNYIHKKNTTGSLFVDGSGGPDTNILPFFFININNLVMVGPTVDLEEWVLWNGGVDVRKLIARNEQIAKNCKEKWGKFKMDYFGQYSAEEIRDLLIERATPEELKFKEMLDSKGIEYTFQKIIRRPKSGFYIVDFYLPFKNLIIKIDGKYHQQTRQKFNDDIRTQNLKNMGFKIKRITNEEVNEHINK